MTRRRLVAALSLVVILTALLAGWLALDRSKRLPMTDAGEVAAAIVKVSAIVPGRVVEVAVENNQSVEKGDLLFRVDPEPYKLELAQAQAALTTARSELAQGERNLQLERSNADVAAAQIERAENNLGLSKQTLARLEPLLQSGYVTEQEVETARTAVADAQVTLNQALVHAQGIGDFVGTLDTRRAQVALAEASVALAERNLRNTEIFAPRSGRITGLLLSESEYVVTGAPLFSLIDTAHWHVSALFRETDLAEIREGDTARVYLMAAPHHPIEAVVHSIGWGQRSAEEANVFGMPVVANKLDWVRAARRYPVEVMLINPPEGLIRVGMSASVRILGEGADHTAPAH